MNHIHAIRQNLARFDLDAMLLTEEANRFYATGFHSTGSDGAALITRDDAYYFTDFRYIEAASAAIRDAHVELVDSNKGYLAHFTDVIRRHGIKTLGFEDGYMTVAAFRRYEENLPCQLQPATTLLWELRAQKDSAELAALEAAQRIAESALTEILNDIRPGVTEKEIAAKLTYLMLRGGAENMSFDPIVVSGPKSSMPHGVPGQRVFEAGDFITMDFGCIYHGYCSDMTRTVALGHVTDEMAQVYATVLAAQKAGIAAAKAGVTGCAIDKAGRDVIAAAGYGPYFGHSFGHGVGVEIHESPSASPSYDRPLPVGAVISAEPGIYLPGRFGVRIEDVIVLTEDGCRDLTKAPKELLIL